MMEEEEDEEEDTYELPVAVMMQQASGEQQVDAQQPLNQQAQSLRDAVPQDPRLEQPAELVTARGVDVQQPFNQLAQSDAFSQDLRLKQPALVTARGEQQGDAQQPFNKQSVQPEVLLDPRIEQTESEHVTTRQLGITRPMKNKGASSVADNVCPSHSSPAAPPQYCVEFINNNSRKWDGKRVWLEGDWLSEMFDVDELVPGKKITLPFPSPNQSGKTKDWNAVVVNPDEMQQPKRSKRKRSETASINIMYSFILCLVCSCNYQRHLQNKESR